MVEAGGVDGKGVAPIRFVEARDTSYPFSGDALELASMLREGKSGM